MKKIVLISVFVTLVVVLMKLSAQNNLQFKDSKFYEYAAPNLANGIYSQAFPLIVPDSSVLKIESAGVAVLASSNLNEYVDNPSAYLSINDKLIYNTSTYSLITQFPIWLPAGTYEVKLSFVYSGTIGRPLKAYISGIEFKLVP